MAAESLVTERESLPLDRRKVSKELDVFQGGVFMESLIHNWLLCNWGFSSLKTEAHFGTSLRVG